jgi:hypothetical protein
MMEKYRITASQIVNIDEKGFLIGRQHKTQRVVSREQFQKGRNLNYCVDGNREWVTLLAGITADGKALTPGIIFQSDSGYLQDTWLHSYNVNNAPRVVFGTTESGWSNSHTFLSWLGEVDKATNHVNSRRLLLLDGCSSHLGNDIIDYLDSKDFLIAFLPPHTTHILQPLDVGCFGPLAREYSNQLDKRSGLGGFIAEGTNKGDFWRLFLPSWEQAMSKRNIEAAFKATGIWSFDPKRVKSRLPPEQTKQEPIIDRSTRNKQIRHLRRSVLGSRDPNLPIVMDMLETVAAETELLKHEVTRLAAEIDRKRHRPTRGKQITAPDLPEKGKGLLLSPSKIVKWRQDQVEQQARQAVEEAERANRKQDREAAAALKKAELEQRKQDTARKREASKLKKEEEARIREARKAARLAEKERINALKLAGIEKKEASKKRQKPEEVQNTRIKRVKRVVAVEEEETEEEPEPTRLTRTGRVIRLPQQYRQK